VAEKLRHTVHHITKPAPERMTTPKPAALMKMPQFTIWDEAVHFIR
jgi:hypothetical protein